MNAVDRSGAAADASKAPPPFDVLEQAAQWFALLRSGSATDQDHGRWQDWLAQRSEHRRAWQYVETISRRFRPIQSADDQRAAAAALQAVRGRRLTRRQTLGGIAFLAGGGLAAWTAWRETPLPELAMAWAADYRTGVGEVRAITLDDGSRVWLNTASALDVDYRPTLRHLRLVAGEVLIQTAGDPRRSFVVDTEDGRLRALGTRFTVRRDLGFTYLAVYEGAVEIRTAGNGTTRIIAAGRQTTFSRDGIRDATSADQAREAWVRGVLLAEDIPLKDLIGELSRYAHGHFGVAPEVAGLRVLGSYPLNDPGRALAMLERVLPIQVRRPLPWWTTVEARKPGA